MRAQRPRLWAASAPRLRNNAGLEAFGHIVKERAFCSAAPGAAPLLLVRIFSGNPCEALAAAADIGAEGFVCCDLKSFENNDDKTESAREPQNAGCVTAAPAAGPGGVIALVGPMAAGKSAIGPLLARRLGLPFFDSDSLIEGKAGKSVAEIFRTDGEAAFRALESEVLSSIIKRGASVLATGGGVVLSELNRSLLRQQALTVWLHASPEDLAKRLGNTKRPLLEGGDPLEKIRTIYNERIPLYAEASSFLVSTHCGDPERIAESIYEEILSAGHC